MMEIGRGHPFGIEQFQKVVYGDSKLALPPEVIAYLEKGRRFVDYLLDNDFTVYGLTTGFADLRNNAVSPQDAAALSYNILQSHDAGIGEPLSPEITLGAMAVRAHSLARGHSAIQVETLRTLIGMINARIIPCVPNTGSLGASGDLAFLSRLGRAMQGHDVPVWVRGQVMKAGTALTSHNIPLFNPKAKEGLALTNGTSFMASMISIAYLREIQLLENMFAGLTLFLNAIEAIDAGFYANIQQVRGQVHQKTVAELLLNTLKDSPFVDRSGVQNDYSIRCLPQIFGPRFEAIFDQFDKIERELNAVTDNPLLFCGEDISSDVNEKRLIEFEGEPWVVLSGGNFHGEVITTIADTLLLNNAKIALTIERHLTYLLNPFRNGKKLPPYLIAEQEKAGLQSGYMITQYTANALTQKMAQMGMPASLFNITSANESEDVVSYGASAAERLLTQLDLFENLIAIYLTTAAQAYALRRQGHDLDPTLLSERLFKEINSHASYPTQGDHPFDHLYKMNQELIRSHTLRKIQAFPLSRWAFGSSKKFELLKALIPETSYH